MLALQCVVTLFDWPGLSGSSRLGISNECVVGYSSRGFRMASDVRQTTVEYLTSTTIGEKGQITVPKQFREELGLTVGAPFAVLRLGDGLILLPEQQRFEQLSQRISSTLISAGLKPETILATLPEIRKHVFARHYGTSASTRLAGRPRKGRRGR